MVRFIPDMHNVHHRDEERYRAVQLERKWRRLSGFTAAVLATLSLPLDTRTLWVSLLSGASCYVQPGFAEDTGWCGGMTSWLTLVGGALGVNSMESRWLFSR